MMCVCQYLLVRLREREEKEEVGVGGGGGGGWVPVLTQASLTSNILYYIKLAFI